MNRSEVMDFINEIEEKFPVDEWVVDGIYVWPLLRISMSMQLYRQNINGGTVTKRNIVNKLSDYSTRIVKLARLLYLNGLHKNKPGIYDSQNYLFIGDQISRILLNDTWYDRFCDPVIEGLKNMDGHIIHMEPYYDAKLPSYYPTKYLQPMIDYIRLKALLSDTHSNKELDKFELFTKDVLEEFPHLGVIINSVLEQMEFVIKLTNYYTTLLSKINPQVVFIVDYYNNVKMSIINACKRLNIPTVDIQHGAQGDLHVAYGRWNKVPKGGFNLLPDYFWVWSELEASAINKWVISNGIDIHNPFIGGNLWLEMWKGTENALVSTYNNKFKYNLNVDNKLVILLTLQPLTFEEGYPEWLLNSINKSPDNWQWQIRLHPGMLHERDKVKKLFNPENKDKVEIDVATDSLLPIILKNVDVHITSFSSTVIEAQDFGIYSIVIDYRGEECYRTKIDTGWIVTAYNEDELIKAIQLQAEKKEIIQHNDSNTSEIINRFLNIVKKTSEGY